MSEKPAFLQDENWKEELTNLICSVVREERDSRPHSCELEGAPEFFKTVGTFGKGSPDAGVETFRANHQWMAKQRERADRVSIAFFIVIVTTVTGGMLSALWLGVKRMITGSN